MGKLRKTIGIVGFGYVGKAIYHLFELHYIQKFHDPNYQFSSPKEDINDCDVAFVCVPTPSKSDGSCDISIVEECVSWIQAPLIILKSTVSPGTTDYLSKKYSKRIVFSPEYCGESSYWTPYKFHKDIIESPFFIFGGSPQATSECVDLFLPVTGPVKIYRQTTAMAAEIAKYMENCFYATKISFCYDIARLAEKAGIDFNEVRELWLLDPRINPMHTAVFKDNEYPFSGKCLPKDLEALLSWGKQIGYEPHILKAVSEFNLGKYKL